MAIPDSGVASEKGNEGRGKGWINCSVFLIIPLLNVEILFVTKGFGTIWAVVVVALRMRYGWHVEIKGGIKETLRE